MRRINPHNNTKKEGMICLQWMDEDAEVRQLFSLMQLVVKPAASLRSVFIALMNKASITFLLRNNSGIIWNTTMSRNKTCNLKGLIKTGGRPCWLGLSQVSETPDK